MNFWSLKTSLINPSTSSFLSMRQARCKQQQLRPAQLSYNDANFNVLFSIGQQVINK